MDGDLDSGDAQTDSGREVDMNIILHKRGPKHRTSSIQVESEDARGRKLTADDLRKRAQRRWGPGRLVQIDEDSTNWKWEYVTR